MRSFQCAQHVYDATVIFCNHFVEKRSRTHDQMVQAARSGVREEPLTFDLQLGSALRAPAAPSSSTRNP